MWGGTAHPKGLCMNSNLRENTAAFFLSLSLVYTSKISWKDFCMQFSPRLNKFSTNRSESFFYSSLIPGTERSQQCLLHCECTSDSWILSSVGIIEQTMLQILLWVHLRLLNPQCCWTSLQTLLQPHWVHPRLLNPQFWWTSFTNAVPSPPWGAAAFGMSWRSTQHPWTSTVLPSSFLPALLCTRVTLTLWCCCRASFTSPGLISG